MAESKFYKKLEKGWKKNKFLCIGLDSDYEKLPKSIKGKPADRVFKFNKSIIDKTHDIALAYKPNSAFYEALGVEGQTALEKTVKYIKKNYPEIIIILDAKRADIGNTNSGYTKAAYDLLDVDAITLHPYLGREAIQTFLDYKDKGSIILVKTSNPGASEFQDLMIANKQPFYLTLAKKIAKDWNENNNIAMVVGATYPDEIKKVRKAVGDIPFLIPGIGKQGGDIEKTVKAAQDSRGWGMIINSSRDIIFASSESDFAASARKKAIETNEGILKAKNG